MDNRSLQATLRFADENVTWRYAGMQIIRMNERESNTNARQRRKYKIVLRLYVRSWQYI